MNKRFLKFLIIFHILSFCFNDYDNVYLEISRSKSLDETTSLTPLVVSLSSEDTAKKMIGVDLICVVDISYSMYGDKMDMVKDTLKYLVDLMNENDKLAIITFSDSAKVIQELLPMKEANKEQVNKKIDDIDVDGATNILEGLIKGLSVIKDDDDYSSGERILSIILLSDGVDNYNYNIPQKFEKEIIDHKKQNCTFTLHTLGYGEDHHAELMYELSLIRDGGYFFIRYLSMVKDAVLEIYGSLSTNYQINVGISIYSNYTIKKVYGIDDMYQSSLLYSSTKSEFKTKLIHFVYGKRYIFVTLVDIPKDIKHREIVLTAVIETFNKKIDYLWDNSLHSFAFEDYIKAISFDYFQEAYNNGQSKGITIMNSALIWLNTNYDGNKDWKSEYNDIINDLKNFKEYGKANILSKLRELKSCKLGIHYNDENSYQRKIIDDSYDINIDKTWVKVELTEQKDYDLEYSAKNSNYLYFYLKEGSALIDNKIVWSGESSSLIFYHISDLKFHIKPISSYVRFFYKFAFINRLQFLNDFSRGGKFFLENDFPFEFYTHIDGTKDITFNIQFLKL